MYRKPRKDPKRPFGFGYAERTEFSPGEGVTPLGLPETAIPVAEILP